MKRIEIVVAKIETADAVVLYDLPEDFEKRWILIVKDLGRRWVICCTRCMGSNGGVSDVPVDIKNLVMECNEVHNCTDD